MADNRYTRNSGCVYNLKYHIVWCPKYRRKVITGNYEKRLRFYLYKKAKEQDWIIESLEIMPDHVHCFISCDTTDAPQRIVNQLKGYTSRMLREEFPELKSRLPSMWSRSYFISSIGHISEDTVKKYIENQKGV